MAHDTAKRPRSNPRHQKIELWWNQGLAIKEIADRLGTTSTSVGVAMSRMRGGGHYSLPYRHQYRHHPVFRRSRPLGLTAKPAREAIPGVSITSVLWRPPSPA